jgi:phospholipid/cholesterol/gamma-HCH transport system ATP-binding protein
LYDELTTGLDPVTAREISTLIVDIQRKFHTASIVISHDMHCVKIVSDRVALLDGGKCYWQGKYEEMEASGDPVLKQFFE